MINNTQKLLAATISIIMVVGITPAFADPANAGSPTVALTSEQLAKISSAPWAEQGDAGQLPGTAQSVGLIEGDVTAITGTISTNDDIDMFRLCLNDASNWEALVQADSFDTSLSLFDKDGNGFVFNDDNFPPGGFGSRIGDTGPNPPAEPQEVLLAIASFFHEPLDGGAFMTSDGFADGQISLIGTVDGWYNGGESSGTYNIILTGFDVESCKLVGGESLPIDNTALILAGLQTSAVWMIPVLAGAVGAGAFYLKTRANKE